MSFLHPNPVAMPTSQNPLVVLAWILAVFVGLPGTIAAIKAIFFLASASKDLKTVVAYVQQRRGSDSVLDITLTLVENDINVLQKNANVTVREWPDRRVGPADRRTS